MLLSDIKLLSRFATSSLLEEVGQTYMSPLGTDTVVQIADGGGYIMQDDQYLYGDGISSSGYSLDVEDAMTIGFWLYSYSPGLAINPDDSSPTSIEMPLLDFISNDSSESSVFQFTENTSLNGNSYLTVSIEENKYSASSEEYAPFLWHYFWIVYSDNELFIYVDGNRNELQDEQGIYQSSVDGSSINLYINHNRDGYAFNKAKNKGIIGDIFISNVTDYSDINIQRAINDGIEFIVDNSYTNKDIDKFGIYFNDPETITVSSLIDDMSYVFIGRNDGKILRGSSLLWEVRRAFSSSKEIENLGLVYDPLDKGFLKLSSETVRL
jgi:hypothetical protein